MGHFSRLTARGQQGLGIRIAASPSAPIPGLCSMIFCAGHWLAKQNYIFTWIRIPEWRMPSGVDAKSLAPHWPHIDQSFRRIQLDSNLSGRWIGEVLLIPNPGTNLCPKENDDPLVGDVILSTGMSSAVHLTRASASCLRLGRPAIRLWWKVPPELRCDMTAESLAGKPSLRSGERIVYSRSITTLSAVARN